MIKKNELMVSENKRVPIGAVGFIYIPIRWKSADLRELIQLYTIRSSNYRYEVVPLNLIAGKVVFRECSGGLKYLWYDRQFFEISGSQT
jgi:hypothetical protein